MFKKTIAMTCVVTSLLTQIAFANTQTDLRSPNAESFYEKYTNGRYTDVFFNGTYVYFEDAQPLVLDGTTFVPIRAFSETLGAEVGFIEETFEVVILKDGNEIRFKAGEANIYVNDELKVLSNETFIMENRTMVPLRLISEAFGFDVLWNQTDRQVSITDLEELKIGFDEDYSLLQAINEMSNFDLTENLKMTGDIDIKVGEEGNLVGADIDFTTIIDSDLTRMDFYADCKIDIQEIQNRLNNALNNGEIDEITYKVFLSYIETIMAFDVNFVMDIENLDLYFNSSIIEKIALFLVGETDITADTFLKLSYSDYLTEDELLEISKLIQESKNQTVSAQNMLETAINDIIASAETTNLFETNVYEQAKYIVDILKDENFEKTADGYTLADETTIYIEEIGFGMDINVDININIDENGEVISYEFNFDVESLDDQTNTFKVSQENKNEINVLISSKILVGDTYEISEVLCYMTKEETDLMPQDVPTENVINISELG